MYRCESCGNIEQEIHDVVCPKGLQCCVDPVYVTVEEESVGPVPREQGVVRCLSLSGK